MFKVLVPTDFSDIADHGLKLAIDLVDKVGGEIILLNVVFPVHGTTFASMGDINTLPRGQADRFMVELVRKNKERLNHEIRKFSKGNVKIIPRIDFEDAVNGLNHYVKEHELDFIVMGTKGSKSLTEHLFGTETENVIKVSHCPVITVKGEVEDFTPENIVFAVDVKNENYEGISRLQNFADKMNSKVHFLYVMDDGMETSEAVSKLKSLAKANNFKNFTINTVNSKNTEDIIKNFARRKSADMVAVVSEGKKGIRDWLFGSITNDIVNSIDIPVFVMGG